MGFLRQCWLFLALSQACTTWASTSAPAPGIFEVDLIFPRNETYSPSRLFPYLFAIQNPSLVGNLSDTVLSWTIERQGVPVNASLVTEGGVDLSAVNFANSDPYFIWGWDTEFNIEGTFLLSLVVDTTNCSQDLKAHDDLATHWYMGAYRRELYFSTKNSSSLHPDFAAVMDNNMCGQAQGLAFNATQLLHDPSSVTSNGEGYCAVFPPELPSPTPCKVKIDEPAAASISAAITSKACRMPSSYPELNCPTPTPNHAASIMQPLLASGLWLSALLGLLTYNIV